MYAIKAAACALLLAASASTSVEAQDEAASDDAAPLWLVSCTNQAEPATLTCEFSQSIVLTQGNQRVATASFVKDAGQPGMTGLFTVPVGVHLPVGLTVAVDGADMAQAGFLFCDAQGCYAEAEVDQEWLDQMRAGREMTLAVEGADRRPAAFTFQLEDLAAAEALLP